MDGDPAVEPQLDSFSLTFPLPYRVAFIVVLGKDRPGQDTARPSVTPIGHC